MSKENAQEILGIYQACSAPLFQVLREIDDKQLNWKPAPESRSIGEIVRHLIRVDNWFLKRLGFEPQAIDPGNATAEEIAAVLGIVQAQIVRIFQECKDDAELGRASKAPDAKEHETLGEVIIHISQHYLYHLAQMIYLRRAMDRSWTPPLEQWEKATHVISAALAPIRKVRGLNSGK